VWNVGLVEEHTSSGGTNLHQDATRISSQVPADFGEALGHHGPWIKVRRETLACWSACRGPLEDLGLEEALQNKNQVQGKPPARKRRGKEGAEPE
jgi:hypothetical protein